MSTAITRPDCLPKDTRIRWVPGYENLYAVTDTGDIYSYHWGTPRKRKVSLYSKRYPSISLSKNKKKESDSVHRLVLKAFVGDPPKGHECRHLDGNQMNNRLSNLEWGTPKRNQADRIKHGTSNRGERNHFAKLTVADVRKIKQLYPSSGMSQAEVSKMFGINRATVSYIYHGKTWTHIKPGPTPSWNNEAKESGEIIP